MASTSFVRAAAFVLLACVLTTQAQTQTRDAATRTGDAAAQTNAAAQTAPSDKPSPDAADLSITARVTARELLFRKVPNPTVEFTGKPERRTLWESERENLPEQAQPGITYRNVGITLRIVSVFADIDRIVAEALGEIPSTDSNAPGASAPPASEPESPTPPSATQTAPAKTPSETSRRDARRAGSDRGGRTARTPE